MRTILFLSLGSALLVGCQHPKPSETAKGKGETAPQQQAKKPDTKSAKTNARVEATAINESAGKVASVNAVLRFVVIDFALNRVPQVDQRLGVFRQGQKVGEVKISSQSRNNIVAADLTAGEATVGDEVRPD